MYMCYTLRGVRDRCAWRVVSPWRRQYHSDATCSTNLYHNVWFRFGYFNCAIIVILFALAVSERRKHFIHSFIVLHIISVRTKFKNKNELLLLYWSFNEAQLVCNRHVRPNSGSRIRIRTDNSAIDKSWIQRSLVAKWCTILQLANMTLCIRQTWHCRDGHYT